VFQWTCQPGWARAAAQAPVLGRLARLGLTCQWVAVPWAEVTMWNLRLPAPWEHKTGAGGRQLGRALLGPLPGRGETRAPRRQLLRCPRQPWLPEGQGAGAARPAQPPWGPWRHPGRRCCRAVAARYPHRDHQARQA
jgi:hypothetical protein